MSWYIFPLVAQMVKHLPAMRESPGFNPWVRKIPWRRKWQPTQVLLPGKFHGWRSLVGYSPWGCKESNTTEWLHFHTFTWYVSWKTSFDLLLLSYIFIILCPSSDWILSSYWKQIEVKGFLFVFTFLICYVTSYVTFCMLSLVNVKWMNTLIKNFIVWSSSFNCFFFSPTNFYRVCKERYFIL